MSTKRTIFDYYDMGARQTMNSANDAFQLSQKLFDNSVDHYDTERRKMLDRVLRENPNVSIQNLDNNPQNQPEIVGMELFLDSYNPAVSGDGGVFADKITTKNTLNALNKLGIAQALTNNQTQISNIGVIDDEGEVFYKFTFGEMVGQDGQRGPQVRYNALTGSYGEAGEGEGGKYLTLSENEIKSLFEDFQANTLQEKRGALGETLTFRYFNTFSGNPNMATEFAVEGNPDGGLNGTPIGSKQTNEDGAIITYASSPQETNKIIKQISDSLNANSSQVFLDIKPDDLINMDEDTLRAMVNSNVAERPIIKQTLTGPFGGGKTTYALTNDLLNAKRRYQGLKSQELRLQTQIQNLEQEDVSDPQSLNARRLVKFKERLSAIQGKINNFDVELNKVTGKLANRMDKQEAKLENKLITDPKLKTLKQELEAADQNMTLFSNNKQGKDYQNALKEYNSIVEGISAREEKIKGGSKRAPADAQIFNRIFEDYNTSQRYLYQDPKDQNAVEFVLNKLRNTEIGGKDSGINVGQETRRKVEELVMKNYNPNTGVISLLNTRAVNGAPGSPTVETTKTGGTILRSNDRAFKKAMQAEAKVLAYMTLNNMVADGDKLKKDQLIDFINSAAAGYGLDPDAYKAALEFQKTKSDREYETLKDRWADYDKRYNYNTVGEDGNDATSNLNIRTAINDLANIPKLTDSVGPLGTSASDEAIDAIANGIKVMREFKNNPLTADMLDDLHNNQGNLKHFYYNAHTSFAKLTEELVSKIALTSSSSTRGGRQALAYFFGYQRSVDNASDATAGGMQNLSMRAIYDIDGMDVQLTAKQMSEQAARGVFPKHYEVVEIVNNTPVKVGNVIDREDLKSLAIDARNAGAGSGINTKTLETLLLDHAITLQLYDFDGGLSGDGQKLQLLGKQ